MNAGIVSYGLYFPDKVETKEQIAEKAGMSAEEVAALGLEQKIVPSPEDQPVPMAVKAARKAFEQAGDIGPEDVDLVLWTGEEYKDYIAQTASIRLQEEIGCKNAWAFDLVGQGVTSVQGLRVAHDMMIGDPSVNTVLLAGGTRNIDLVDYTNPDTRFLLSSSASGAALLLKRDHPENVLLSTAFLTDFHMADEVFVPGGGTEHPFSEDNLGSPMMFYQTPNPNVVSEYLSGRWTEALVQVIKDAAKDSAVDYLALRQLSVRDKEHVLRALDLKPSQTQALDRWGHHGPNDVILSLALGVKEGSVSDGSVVVLASAGIGFTYAAAAVRWGKTP